MNPQCVCCSDDSVKTLNRLYKTFKSPELQKDHKWLVCMNCECRQVLGHAFDMLSSVKSKAAVDDVMEIVGAKRFLSFKIVKITLTRVLLKIVSGVSSALAFMLNVQLWNYLFQFRVITQCPVMLLTTASMIWQT